MIDYLIILFILVIGMWQLFFCQALMKWDMADINLPWNYYISECINHGQLPLWNPYSRFGFPQYGDPGTWYPVKWIIGLFRQYDLYAIHFEYLLHLFLAAIGMYKLGNFLGFSRQTKLIAAVTYMFSGFFIGNAQHIWWLINATWLPFAFLYLLRLNKKPGFADAIKLGFVFFLMLSGGYPGLFISTVYLFFCTVIVLIINHLKERNYILIRKFLLFLLVAGIVFAMSSLVVLVSSFDFSDYINRGTALPYDSGGALFGAFSPRALLSVLFSYPASINNIAFWRSDFSMVNTFFGLLSLMILLFFLLTGKAPLKSFYFTAIAILFLMLAMSEVFPFRRWLYLYVPFMNLFRFSSLFRLFAIFFLILATGFSMERLFSRVPFRSQFIRYFWITGLLTAAFLIVIFFYIDKWMFRTLFTEGFLHFDSIAGISDKVFFQGLIFLGLVSGFLFFQSRMKEWGSWMLVMVIFIEMIISVQLNINATVVDPFSPKPIQNHLKKLPAGFPVPSLSYAMRTTNDTTMGKTMPFLWRNLGELYKIPSSGSFSPYKLNTLQTAIRKNTLDQMVGQPLVFLAKSLKGSDQVDTSTILDTGRESIRINRFRPGDIKMETHTDTTLFLVLLQNEYPHWYASIDNVKQEIIRVNDTFMALRLPKGDHHVLLEFRSKKITLVFWISFICWIFCLAIIIFSLIKTPDPRLKTYPGLVLVILILFIFTILIINNRQRYHSENRLIPALEDFAAGLGNDSVSIVLNVDNPAEYSPELIRQASITRLQLRNDLSALQEFLMKMDSEYILFAQFNTTYMPETDWLITQYYPAEITRREFGAGYYTLRKKGPREFEPLSFISLNDFETPVSGWSLNSADIDTKVKFSGNKSNRLDSASIYSSTFTAMISELPNPRRKYFRITLHALNGPGTDAFIVFDVTRKDKTYIWNATKINDMIAAGDQWSKVCMIKCPYERIRNDDVLKIYVWNNSKGVVWIDDFKVELIERNRH